MQALEWIIPAITRVAGQLLIHIRKDMKEFAIFGAMRLICTVICFSYYLGATNEVNTILLGEHCFRICLFLARVYLRSKFWKILNSNQQNRHGQELIRVFNVANEHRLFEFYFYVQAIRILSFVFWTPLFFKRHVFNTYDPSNSYLRYLMFINIVLYISSSWRRMSWIYNFTNTVLNMKISAQDFIIESNSSVVLLQDLSSKSRYASSSCSICMDDYGESCEIRILSCQHHFHMNCIDIWLNNRPSCPLCLNPITRRRV